jgi:DNA-binding NtrC family response regulator
MGSIGGLAVLQAARTLSPPVDVIVFTAYGEIETAVKAMRMGALDFLTKPVTLEQVASRLDRVRRPEAPLTTPTAPFVSYSREGVRLLDELRQVADVPTPIWIEGETGTGRTYTAQVLHELSPGGQDAPLTVVDLPLNNPWPERGTALLANADDLTEPQQRQLLRRLNSVPSGVRLISTSEPDALQRVKEGEFRADLYYRLAVVRIRVPPLRNRPEDVVPMFESALNEFCARYHRPRQLLPDWAPERLRRQSWPGNIRELRNLAERVAVIGPDALLEETSARTNHSTSAPEAFFLREGFSLSEHLEQVERDLLEVALRQAAGDRNLAGKLLNVERNTLRYKLNKYGLLER